jgi:2,3-bisphosphoglycerate-independent phosphoglycerate mutase
LTFHSGVSYRNLLVLHGKQFSPEVTYAKPDSSHGEAVKDLLSAPRNNSKEATYTANFLNDLLFKVADFLTQHPLNKQLDIPANSIWPWSPGYRPAFKRFSEKYDGKKGAIISAVDVIKGIGLCADMSVIDVPGATGFIDTNYKGKANAALEAIKTHDFVYVHIEAIDECSHMGDLELKCKAIADFENKIVKPIMNALEGEDITFALLPDHPVPIELRKHTRTPVPLAICGPRITPDDIISYSEINAPNGQLGQLQDDQLIKLMLSDK